MSVNKQQTQQDDQFYTWWTFMYMQELCVVLALLTASFSQGCVNNYKFWQWTNELDRCVFHFAAMPMVLWFKEGVAGGVV